MTIQNQPIEDGHDDATVAAKIEGIVEQTKQDVAQGNVSDLPDALRQRFTDSRIEVDDDQFEAILKELG